jgi:hypothetical protein
MSGKQKPYTPKIGKTDDPPEVAGVEAAKPFASNVTERKAIATAAVETCGGCRHWRSVEGKHDGQSIGFCTVRPPSIGAGPTAVGLLCRYPVTTEDTAACGLAEAK